MLRKKLAQYEKALTLFNDEKFDDLAGNFVLSVYCFFQTKASSIGIEILEMLKRIQDKHGEESGLNINIIYTRDGGQRLVKDSALEILDTEHKRNPV